MTYNQWFLIIDSAPRHELDKIEEEVRLDAGRKNRATGTMFLNNAELNALYSMIDNRRKDT